MATISEALATAMQHHQAGRLRDAEPIYRQILQVVPNHADAHHLLGVIAHQTGNNDFAIASIGKAIQLNGRCAAYHTNMGEVYRILRRVPESIACYRRALELNPNDVLAHNSLGTVTAALGNLGDASACFQRALKLNPTYAEAHNNLGNVLKEQGRPDEAVACYRRSLELNSRFVPIHSNLLLALHYCEGVSLPSLADAHAEYQTQHAARLSEFETVKGNAPQLHDRLRLGFVSSDLGRHPVGFFLIRLFENLQHESMDLFCYSDRGVKDDLTLRLQSYVNQWRDVVGLNDEQLARQIRADEVDILVDLAGHTARNRLLVFARKPAPIQITWLGYVGTTGVRAIDYILADRNLIPPEAEPFYCEKVLRMPDNYACYYGPDDAPAPGPLPAVAHGYVTFGSFNNLAKITSQVIEIWAEILHRVPKSRLVIRHRGIDDIGTRQRFVDLFVSRGIASDRLDLFGWSPFETRMNLYNEIDIGLDPFPYSGATTTCDALWMGVPVITCPFDTFASRQSLTHLLTVGLDELVARDLEDYVRKAIELSQNLPRLLEYRTTLRNRMAASPLCNGPRFTANFVDLLRQLMTSTLPT